MWLVFGSKTQARPVDGGRELDLECPHCRRITRWVECEMKDEHDKYFAKVGAATVRRMVCTTCGEYVAFDALRPPPSTPPSKRSTEWDREALLAALRAKMKRGGK